MIDVRLRPYLVLIGEDLYKTPMNKLEEIVAKRKQAHSRLFTLKSRVYEAFLNMEKATYGDGALPRKRRNSSPSESRW
jgi:hypothetical protein